jgi:predicted peptidase
MTIEIIKVKPHVNGAFLLTFINQFWGRIILVLHHKAKTKMKPTLKAICLIVFFIKTTSLYSQSTLQLKKASDHPIRYYISLPNNWSAKTRWPIVIVLSDAYKQFKKDAEQFVEVRKDLPFIIISPFITTNGTQGHRDSTIYPYSKSTWDSIDKMTICNFDETGLQSIIKDVKKNHSGSDKVFITAFEAGTHLVWAMIFQHPELLYAAAPIAGNFRNRCIENSSFSNDASRIDLPIKNFTGSDDKDFGMNGKLYNQYLEAKKLAISHGYKNISETEVQGKGHVPLPENVLSYFNSVWKSIKN